MIERTRALGRTGHNSVSGSNGSSTTGADIRVIALWLGHESPTTTHQYVEADPAMKERALAGLEEPDIAIRRFHAPDSLLEFLKTL